MLVVLIIWVIAAILAVVIAGNKNRSAIGWFLAAVFLTPLSVLVLLALEPLPPAGAAAEQAALAAGVKKCPMCAETVQAEAKICKHCRHEFADPPPAAVKEAEQVIY